MTDFRNLPPEVLARLAEHDLDAGVKIRGDRTVEHVRFKPEIRVDEAGNVDLVGYATVYDHAYDVAGGAPYGWSETICAGACDRSVSERDDVRLLVNHDGIALARTRSKTLTLESDSTGLRVSARLDAQSPSVQSLTSAMNRGDMDEMSFAFKVNRQEWNADYTERSISEVKLYDVSVVTYPANPATVTHIRNDDKPAPPAAYPLSLALTELEQYRRQRTA